MKSFFRMSYPYILWIAIFIVAPMFMILLYAVTRSGNDTLTFTFTLDKLSRQEFTEMLEAAETMCARMLRADAKGAGTVLPSPLPERYAAVFSRAREFLDRNVGTGHVAGYLCAELNRRV